MSEIPAANYLTIEGKSYPLDENGYGTGWSWDAAMRTLSLYSYHSSAISATGDIRLSISGVENVITARHGPAITVTNGSLFLTGSGTLSLRSSDAGIIADGPVHITDLTLHITAETCGIHTGRGLTAENTSLCITTPGIGIQNTGGDLLLTALSLCLTADTLGITTDSRAEILRGTLVIDSPYGSGLTVSDGPCRIENSRIRISGSEHGLTLENGDLTLRNVTAEVLGTAALAVQGSLTGTGTHLYTTGDTAGIIVSGDCTLTAGNCSASADTGISITGNLETSDTRMHITGETRGVHIRQNLRQTGGSLSVQVKSGPALTIGGSMETSGTIDTRSREGIDITGELTIRSGTVTITAESCGLTAETYHHHAGSLSILSTSGTGLTIHDSCTVDDGTLEAAGFDTGIAVQNTFTLTGGSVFSSGKCGMHLADTHIETAGRILVFGDTCGIRIENGDLAFSQGSLDVSGDCGMQIQGNVTLAGGILRIDGKNHGILIKDGDLTSQNAITEITSDLCGLELETGSVRIASGLLHIRLTGDRETSDGIRLGCGHLTLTGGLTRILGGTTGVEIPAGTLTLDGGELDTAGSTYGISAPEVHPGHGVLTAHGGAAALSPASLLHQSEEHRVQTGRSWKTYQAEPYAGQRSLHIYPAHFFAIQVPAALENLEPLVSWVADALHPYWLPETFVSRMILVTEELFVNIVNYAYPDTPGDVLFEIAVDTSVKLKVIDFGIPFNPLEAAAPDVHAPLSDREAGGIGIYLTQKFTDRVTYERRGNQNILTIYKRI